MGIQKIGSASSLPDTPTCAVYHSESYVVALGSTISFSARSVLKFEIVAS